MRAAPLGILTNPKSVAEELLFQASAKIGCLILVVHNRTFDAGRFFVCRYDRNAICPYCLRIDPAYGVCKCAEHRSNACARGTRINSITRDQLEMDSGVRCDIVDEDLVIRSGGRDRCLFALADPGTTVDGLAFKLSTILDGNDAKFGPFPIDS